MVPFLKVTSEVVTQEAAAAKASLARLQYLFAANDDKVQAFYAATAAKVATE